MASLHKNMKVKFENSLNRKLILLGFFLLFILLMILRSNTSPPIKQTSTAASLAQPQSVHTTTTTTSTTTHACTKIPPSLADSIVHYATSNTTPQQTLKEISVTARVLANKSPCNFLVLGLGHDSLMWAALNHGGRTVFLEEDKQWIQTMRKQFPQLESYHVKYDTKVAQADGLLEAGRRPECTSTAVIDLEHLDCKLALKGLPGVFYEVEWDVIMVDAPTGWMPEAPGRMGAIYTAGMAARGRKGSGETTDVLVHDVDRIVEDKFSKEFLCEGYLKEQEGRLRHFNIPSHRTTSFSMPFCPPQPTRD